MSAKSVPLRKLGKNGPSLPALGFGLMVMSGGYGTAPSDERFKILDRAVQLGATFWDNSNMYGDNEELLGKWFRLTGKREEIFLATKFGILPGNKIDSSAENCKKSCEESLKKLGVESIDLYYAHRLNPETPVEETMRAMVELQASTTLRRAYKIAPVAAVQQEYSPFQLDIETKYSTNLLSTCHDLNVSVVCYSPLGRGLLTGAFTTRESVSSPGDMRGTFFPRFSEENIDANTKLVNQFKGFADKKGCSTSQLALAWLLKQGDDIIPIPGTKRTKWLEENWGALDVKLTDEEEKEIREFGEGVELLGYRSVLSGKVFSFVDTKEEV
ncbi:putative aldo/keto reductase [Hyaloscypha variabilis]